MWPMTLSRSVLAIAGTIVSRLSGWAAAFMALMITCASM